MGDDFITANNKLKLNMFKLYKDNIIGKPYRNEELYDTLEQAYKNCDIKTPKYINNEICNKNFYSEGDDFNKLINIAINNEKDKNKSLKNNIENVNNKTNEFMEYLISFNDDQKKAVSFNNTILDDLKNKRVSILEKGNKNMNQEYMKYYLINKNYEAKANSLNMFLKPFLIIIIILLIAIILLSFKIIKVRYLNHPSPDF